MNELATLISICRSRPKERALCCPRCGNPVGLEDGIYWCLPALADCGFVTRTLADLAVREAKGAA